MTAETTTPTDLLVLHTLRLTGFAAVGKIAERTGDDPAAVEAVLTAAAVEGRVTERTGRVAGWMLTAQGRADHARRLAEELVRSGARPAVEHAEARFLELNGPFKEICTRWQLRPDGSVNDHTDPAHDRAVVDELGALHPRALAAAWARVDAGETAAFAAPLQDSYHDVWMELHQDLMSTLGRERRAADGH